MANIQRNFIRGRMNKSLDERLVPNGEYVDALNVRLGSTEETEIGAVENSKGNIPLTTLQYVDGTALSSQARCIGAFEDGANLVIYWFVHDPAFTQGATGKLDLIISFDVETGELIYHVISIDNGNGIDTTLNFNPNYLITGVDKIENLLFFTDNFNAPRVINIKQNYGDPASGTDLDTFNQDEILVIKKPPTTAPTIETYYVSTIDDAYLEDKLICFAYRYQYANNEYSATSQFSEPAFKPKTFDFSANSYLNEGMVNADNACNVTFNTGGSAVKSIQLLFKEADNSTIKVIETFNKKELGYTDNSLVTFPFTNRKIFTVLPSSEILRLYDNVPQYAKAQTLMGNRLMYGNYKEGYNLTDAEGSKINLDFTATYKSDEISILTIPSQTSQGDYTYTPTSAVKSVSDSVLNLDLSALDSGESKLKAGTELTINFGVTYFANELSSGIAPAPTPSSAVYDLSWTYTLIEDYNTVYDFVTSTDFQEKIGTASTIQTLSNAQAGNGNTLTDVFNRTIPEAFDATYTNLLQTGITSSTASSPAKGEPITATISGTSSKSLKIQSLAATYTDTTYILYSYYGIVNATASFRESTSIKSLHSNRGYEFGIVYMDDYNRASTALVSPYNSITIPCSKSTSRNYAQIEIPIGQKPPSWATKYKFVVKPTKESYNTIYSNVVYRDTVSNASYFLLEGENATKVEAGDRLIVKADTTGPMTRCITATVLEKEAQSAGFITIYDAAGSSVEVIGGVYMKINASNFTSIQDPNAVIAVDPKKIKSVISGFIPVVAFPFFTATNTSGTTPVYDVYDVPVGTRIVMKVEMQRNGTGTGAGTGRRNYVLEQTLTASTSYTNMADWFIGDNVASTLNSGVKNPGQEQTINNTYVTPQVSTGAPPFTTTGIYANMKTDSDLNSSTYFGGGSPASLDFNDDFYYRIYEDTSTQDAAGNNLIYLLVSGSYSLGRTSNEQSILDVSFTVYRGDSATYIFETEAGDALPDAWYENDTCYNISNGTHIGNVQSQTKDSNGDIIQSAIVQPGFINCFAFGNGAESYKIRDSIKGQSFTLGNRVFTTSNEEYKEAHRFADITYSGVYNDESNVNRLNEFNLGLLNFKALEETYGDVEILYARETDVLTLQEDKISYVLAGKNLLSDSTGGGVVTSVPEVLGQQIARIEDYGISNHPESFAAFGEDKFFSDAKRNVIIKLTGSSAQDETLTVISNEGMRSWFRDLFAEASPTQKLGGYDPYMHEYVFTSNTIIKPETELCTACGVTKNITVVATKEFVYCVDVTDETGTVYIDYVIPFENTDPIITEGTEQQIVTEGGDDIITEGQSSGTGYTIQAIYNGVTYSTGVVYQSGTLSFDKSLPSPTEVVLIVSTDATVDDTIQVTVKCPGPVLFNVYSITLTTNANAGQFIHTEYLWTQGTVTSPTQSDLVTFAASPNDPIVSQYRELEGGQGTNVIPPDGAVITMRSNKINFDDFVFNTTDNAFRYLRTDALYENNSTDMNILLAASVAATPIVTSGAPNLYSAGFTLPAGGDKLYLVYDLRNSLGEQLCFSTVDGYDSCCSCTFPPTPTPTPVAPSPTPAPTYDYYIGIDCANLQAVYVKAVTSLGIVVGDEVQYSFGGVVKGCASLYAVGGTGTDGEVTVQVTGCGDSRCSV